MENQFVPYELAVKLKVLGFDENCFSYYRRDEKFIILTNYHDNHNDSESRVSAPLWQQAFDWFRERHLLFGATQYDHIRNDLSYYIVWGNMGFCCDVEWGYLTYEEARQSCLEKLIEISQGD